MSKINNEKYEEFAALVAPFADWNDDDCDYVEQELDEYIENELEFASYVTRNFYVIAYTCNDYKSRADKAVGFNDTIFIKTTNKQYADKWGYTRSAFPFTVSNGEFDADEVVAAIKDAHARSGYHGMFLADICWNDEMQAFEITVDS